MSGCAERIPTGRYGVERVRVQGMETMDEAALLSCLAVQPRDRFSIVFGANPEPKCGAPPFDASRTTLRMWAWPWSEWPIFDPEVFERDIDRIERWYKARGYYDARVQSSEVIPDPDDHTVAIEIQVAEGSPVLVHAIEITGIEGLPEADRRIVQRAVGIAVGERFDEADYERAKLGLQTALREASYAKAAVTGNVDVDPASRHAHLYFQVDPGPSYVFGRVRVEGNEHLSARAIEGAAGIVRGSNYSDSTLDDAQNAIYGMGPFSSVEIIGEPRGDAPVMDVVVRVIPGRLLRYGLGVGMLVGTPAHHAVVDNVSVAQWDIHFSAHVEHRNFLGGMRRIRLEERPRMIFPAVFPRTTRDTGEGFQLGNLMLADFRQPAFLEARTNLVMAARWDYGPDPFEFYRRHDIDTWIGPERRFLGGRLRVAATLHYNFNTPEDPSQPVSQRYATTFFQEHITLDLRDDPVYPRRGAFFGLALQQAGYFLPSSWDYLRFAPEARFYFPLPARMVLATRMRIGVMHIDGDRIKRCDDEAGRPRACAEGEEPNPDYEDLANLGPVGHRLRGGGQNSVRGYAPNTLGDAFVREREGVFPRLVSGGLRQWEASAELRIPVTPSFGTVLFLDVGDVTRETHFRFNHLNTSVGIGLRYRTLVGPLRLDLGYRIPGLQTLGPSSELPLGPNERRPDPNTMFGLALHLTIGEAF